MRTLVRLRFERANTYLNVLVIALLTGIVLAAYLKMVANQNASTMRSQAWNRCIAVTEAGIEEALTHLNKNGTNASGLVRDGWWDLGGVYYKRGYIDDSIYEVTITPEINPVIVSSGYVPLVQNYAQSKRLGAFLASLVWAEAKANAYVRRAVRVTTLADGMFCKGLIAKHWIDLNGNDIRTDSFDSIDPRYSLNGLYDPSRTKDNGDVATTSGLTNTVNITVANANIHGRVATGPKGAVTVGPSGAVGSHAWHAAGNQGIEPGWFTDDMNVSFPPVPVPFTSGYFTPTGGQVDGTNYALVLGNGKYQSYEVEYSGQEQILVTGKAFWRVLDDFELTGNARLIVRSNAQLWLYVGEPTGSRSYAVLAGNGVVNETGNATNFVYYGLPSNQSLSFTGNGQFTGAIYAPNADFTMNGGGNNIIDFCGAAVGSTIKMNGHFNFHYDENLGRFGPRRGFVILSWNEI